MAYLQEANSNNATLKLELDSAHREQSELYSKLTLDIEYLQRVNLSVNVTLLPCNPGLCHLSDCKLTCLCLSNIHVHYRSSAMVMMTGKGTVVVALVEFHHQEPLVAVCTQLLGNIKCEMKALTIG